MSSLQMILLKLALILESMTSFAIKTTFNICLPTTKACWKSKTKLPTTLLSLFVRILARSMNNPPTKLIDLKSFKSFAPPFLEQEPKKVAFKLFWKDPMFMEFLGEPHNLSFHKYPAALLESHGKAIRTWGFIPT